VYGTFLILTCNERVVTFCNKLFQAIILLQCFISGAIAGIVLGVLLVVAVVVGISASIIVPMVVKKKKEVGENHYTICEYLSRICPKMSKFSLLNLLIKCSYYPGCHGGNAKLDSAIFKFHSYSLCI